MNPATHGTEGNASAPVLYMALELSNKSWRLAFGDGAKRRQVSVPAADLAKLAEAVAKAKERFKLPASARVLSCYEAGRDGWSMVRAPSIEEEDARCLRLETLTLWDGRVLPLWTTRAARTPRPPRSPARRSTSSRPGSVRAPG